MVAFSTVILCGFQNGLLATRSVLFFYFFDFIIVQKNGFLRGFNAISITDIHDTSKTAQLGVKYK